MAAARAAPRIVGGEPVPAHGRRRPAEALGKRGVDSASARPAAGRARRPGRSTRGGTRAARRPRPRSPFASASSQAGPQVGVECAGAGPRAGHRTRHGPVGVGLEGRGDGGELLAGERPLGQRHEAQRPAGIRRDRIASRAMISSSNEPLSDADGELAAGRQQLLGDERQAARALGDEQQQAGRGALALDALDQGRQLVAVERRQEDPFGGRAGRSRWRRGRPSTDRRARPCRAGACPTMARRWSREIRARNVTKARVAASARWRSSRTSTTGRRSPSRPSRPRMPFERPRLASFRGRAAAAPRGPPGDVEDRREVGQQPDDLGCGRSEQVGEVVERQGAQGRTDGPHDRSVGFVRAGGPGRRAQDGHRLAERMHPDDGLVDETGHADTGGPIEQDRPRAATRGVVESSGEARERVVTTHEARARVAGGHGGILRAASARLAVP